MAKHNQPSGAYVDPQWIDEVFIRKLAELQNLYATARAGAQDGYAAICVAGLLRDLVYGPAALYLRVNRKTRLNIIVPQIVMPNWDGIIAAKVITAHYEPFCPPPTGYLEAGRWYPYSVEDYLERDQPGFVIMSRTVSPRQAIHFYANELGGRHLDGEITGKALNAAMIDQGLTFYGVPAIAHLLFDRVASDILRALEPLRRAVAKQREADPCQDAFPSG